MPTDDDAPRPKLQLVPSPQLERLGVDELRTYIDALQTEMLRAQAEIVRKDALRTAADAFFRTP